MTVSLTVLLDALCSLGRVGVVGLHVINAYDYPTVYRISRNIDSDRFGEHIKIAKLTYAIIDPFILQAWVSLHTLLKSANLKSRQQCCLSKLPNIMFANISAYTV